MKILKLRSINLIEAMHGAILAQAPPSNSDKIFGCSVVYSIETKRVRLQFLNEYKKSELSQHNHKQRYNEWYIK